MKGESHALAASNRAWMLAKDVPCPAGISRTCLNDRCVRPDHLAAATSGATAGATRARRVDEPPPELPEILDRDVVTARDGEPEDAYDEESDP